MPETVGEVARTNFKRWADALQTKDPEEVAKLYQIDATFLPTMSGGLVTTPEGVRNYFAHFLERDPDGSIVEDAVQDLGSGYLHSGLYNFEVGPENDRQIIGARFTYLWQLDDEGKWKIVHHHSSVNPEN